MATKTGTLALGALPDGKFVTLDKVQPIGALQARKQKNGAVRFFWRYTHGDVSERVAIGPYDPSAPPKSLAPTLVGFSRAAAHRAAEAHALEHDVHRNDGGRPALLQKRAKAKEAAAEAARRAARNSVQELLLAYCDHLAKIGRRSHADARSIFRLHVIGTWPELARLPAKELTAEHIADMMRSLIEAGKGRTANKLRSYLRAAYQVARTARSKPSVPLLFKDFEITSNPAAETEPDESQNRPDKKPLSAEELRLYWSLIRELPGFRGGLLRLHLLTGAQRIAQLVRLQADNVDESKIVLHDGKGRPGREPRLHTVPLIPAAWQALRDCEPVGGYALSTDGGVTHVAPTTLSDWAADVAAGAIVGFKAKRIRSGVETLLASKGVPQDDRGRLQSHGISGVQERSYDDHDYLDVKRQALEMLFSLLETRTSKKTAVSQRRQGSKQVSS